VSTDRGNEWEVTLGVLLALDRHFALHTFFANHFGVAGHEIRHRFLEQVWLYNQRPLADRDELNEAISFWLGQAGLARMDHSVFEEVFVDVLSNPHIPSEPDGPFPGWLRRCLEPDSALYEGETYARPSMDARQNDDARYLILIGYWLDKDEPGWPDVRAFVDETWDERERNAVADYLDSGLIAWFQAGFSVCRFCALMNGSAERTDGVYVWPEGLAHYVRDHGVRLPRSIIEHIMATWDDLPNPNAVDHNWWTAATLDS
jgi:hypothetical protein